MRDNDEPEEIWDEYDWERFLQQQDRKTEQYMELLERYMDDPNRDQIIAREMVATIDHPALGPIKTLGLPVKLSDTPGAIRTHPPRLGEHTARVLREDLQMDDRQIRDLAARKIVRLLE